jgi:hypothetical protein
VSDWRRPYGSLDYSGSPESCGAVAEAWIQERIELAKKDHPLLDLSIGRDNLQGGGSVIVLSARSAPLAVATIYRTDLNRSMLIRWADEAAAVVQIGDDAQLFELGKRIGYLEAALEPFAEKAAKWEANHPVREGGYPWRDTHQITHRLGDFRTARRALQK